MTKFMKYHEKMTQNQSFKNPCGFCQTSYNDFGPKKCLKRKVPWDLFVEDELENILKAFGGDFGHLKLAEMAI